jgi:hypothetical protein
MVGISAANPNFTKIPDSWPTFFAYTSVPTGTVKMLEHTEVNKSFRVSNNIKYSFITDFRNSPKNPLIPKSPLKQILRFPELATL